MADGRILPIVKENTSKKGKHNKRIGFKSIHKPLVLPSLELSTVDVQLVSSLFSHKQICKKVCEWFTSWRSWQQRILLCGVSDKCTKSQLQALVTTLEPVFHRDFTTSLKGRYPTTLIKAGLVRTAPNIPASFSKDELMIVLQPKRTQELHETRVDSSKTVAEDIERFNSGGVDSLQIDRESDDLQQSLQAVNIVHVDEEESLKDADSPSFSREDTMLSASAHTVQQALDMEENTRHEHAPPFIRRVSTPHFFPQFDHQQLGLMKTALRTGDTDKLYGSAPVTFKHDKWWEGHKGGRLIKPRRSKLSKHFKEQIAQIHQWLDDWQTHERVELLSEVVKCCNDECLNFFAQCLSQRLRDRTDLNCVPDHILLNIFSYLNVRSLCQSSQVCYRWRFLANNSRLWKNKIAALGASEGVVDLAKRIEILGQGQAVDWKQAYREVHTFYKDILKVKLIEEQKEKELKQKLAAARQKRKLRSSELPPKPSDRDDSKTVISGVVDVLCTHSIENVGPAHSAATTELREHGDEFTAEDFDGNDLTGGNLKLLTRSLKALTREDKPEELDVALDVRPTLVQASNLLEKDGETNKHRFRYLSLAVQGVFAVRRVRRLQGHMDAILCLQFDKRRIITGSADRTIRVWDVRSGRSIHKLKGHKGGVRCLQFDNEKIISGSWDMTVMVWHIVKFYRIKVLYGHSGCVSCLQFNDDILVTGSHDRTIRIWSTATWECESVIEGHEGAVTCLQFNEEYIISGSMDRTLRLWSLETRECLQTFVGHKDAVLTLKVLGNLVFSGSADGMIFFWDLETGECQVAIQAHEGPVHSLAYNEYQHFFSSGGDHLLKEWDISTCTCLRSLQGHRGPVFCVKALPHRVVSCSADGFTRIWDLDFPDAKGQRKNIAVEENVITPHTIQQSAPKK